MYFICLFWEGVNLMTTHKNCQKTEEEACRCCRCGSKFYNRNKDNYEIEGHYVFDDKMYCSDCWKKKKGELRYV